MTLRCPPWRERRRCAGRWMRVAPGDSSGIHSLGWGRRCSALVGSLGQCGLAGRRQRSEQMESLGGACRGWGVGMGSIPDVRMASAPGHAASFLYQEAVMSGLSVTGGSAGVQSDLWGARAREWCAMEAQMRPLYEAVFERVGLGHGTELLDAGCGAGLAAQLAARLGVVVSGLDATPALLAIAAERVPNGAFAVADLEA